MSTVPPVFGLPYGVWPQDGSSELSAIQGIALDRTRTACPNHAITVVDGIIHADGEPVRTKWHPEDVYADLREKHGEEAQTVLVDAMCYTLRQELGYDPSPLRSGRLSSTF